MLHLRKYGFDGFTKRGCSAGKPDIQHRAYRDSAAVLFSVVEAESAFAVFLRVFIWAAVFTTASLYATGWAYHDCLHAIKVRGVGKIHFDRSFIVK